MNVLLIEDNKFLCKSISDFLMDADIRCDIANDGETGYFMAENCHYDVLILDIGLPLKSGVEILRSLRKKGMLSPVLMLTAQDGIDYKEVSFDLGADDYLIKPFNDKELLLRIKALARRPYMLVSDTIMIIGKISLDVMNMCVEMSGQQINLSEKETKLLEFLFKRKDSYVTKERILNAVWGFNKSITTNNVEVYVRSMRKRFPPELSGFIIETRYGVGYKLTEVDEDV